MTAIEINSLTKYYWKENYKITALDNITLQFNFGKFYAIMGTSGAGKSTLLQCIGALENDYEGIIKINGKNIVDFNDNQLSKLRKKTIGFIFQSYYLNPNMKAYENVELPIYLDRNMTNKEKKEKAVDMLKKLGLTNRINHYPKELSGGEQQRVAIGRALINNPQIILADEPTGNLDSENEKIIFQILKTLSKHGKCVIVVTHNPSIKAYADTIINIDKGVVSYE